MISLIEIKDSHTLFDNHYQLIKKIGGGGFSEVWLAHDTVAGIDVALKIYTPTGELDEEGKNDFKREFARLCDVNHSNIIHAIGFGIYKDELPYLAMNICKNGSAKRLIGQIEEDEFWNFIEQVASGLQYLHKRGIIHQDMKPDNVLINSDGQYLIIDFGISTKIRSTLRKSVKGNIGGGTPWYMSIESFGKESSSVYARDIWAFGASLYEMMTGDVPFGQYGGMTQKANGGKIPEIKQDFSLELKKIVYDCLALNAWDRPDADQILQRVAAHRAGIKQSGRSNVYRKVLYGIVALLVAVCGMIWYYDPDIDIRTNKQESIAIAKKRNDSIFIASIEKAKMIVDAERLKSNISARNEEKLRSAADIYRNAIKELEVSDSVREIGQQMWQESQLIIDDTYRYLYTTGVRYNRADAKQAAESFWKRCRVLQGCVSETAKKKLESNISITSTKKKSIRQTEKKHKQIKDKPTLTIIESNIGEKSVNTDKE